MSLRLRIRSYQRFTPEQVGTAELGSGSLSIGQAEDNDWVLTDPFGTVADHHCVVSERSGEYFVAGQDGAAVDLLGRVEHGGTEQGGKLGPGQILVVGNFELAVELPADEGGALEAEPSELPQQQPTRESPAKQAPGSQPEPHSTDRAVPSDIPARTPGSEGEEERTVLLQAMPEPGERGPASGKTRDADSFDGGVGEGTILMPAPGISPGQAPTSKVSADDSERTVIRPAYGRSGATIGEEREGTSIPARAPATAAKNASKRTGASAMRLIDAATPLLLTIPVLRQAGSIASIEALRKHLTSAVERFEEQASRSGCDSSTLTTARYLLCSAIDEAVLSTAWGKNAEWAKRGMMSLFFKTLWGGDELLAKLESLAGARDADPQLREFARLCLEVGFANGATWMRTTQSRLIELRAALYSGPSLAGSEVGRGLSVSRGRVSVQKKRSLLPLAMAAVVCLWVATFVGLDLALRKQSAQLVDEIRLVSGRTILSRQEGTTP